MALKGLLRQLLLIGEPDNADDPDENSPNADAHQKPACPACGMVGAIIKSRPEYGGGWLCYRARGGCGEKFANDPASASEPSGDTPPKSAADSQQPRLITSAQAKWLAAEYQRLGMDLQKSLEQGLHIPSTNELTIEGFERLKAAITKRDQQLKMAAIAGGTKAN